MKKLVSILFLLLFLWPSTQAQSESCYQQFLNEGISAFDALNYPIAIRNFEAAAICPDRPANLRKLNEWLQKAKDRFINQLQEQNDIIEAQKSSLEKALTETEIQRQRADSARVIAEGARLALLASNETEISNDTAAMILAYQANQVLEGRENSLAKYAFGQAVYNYFAQTYSSQESNIRNIYALNKEANFLLELEGGSLGKLNKSNQTIDLLGKHGSYIQSLELDANNENILTTADDNTATVWNLTAESQQQIKGHSEDLTFGTFSEDAKSILTGSRDRTAKLWSPSGEALSTLEGHGGTVYEGHFSKDGHLLTRATDGTVILWSQNGQQQTHLKGHTSYVYAATFSPDGQTILTASADGTAKLWSLNGQILQSLEADGTAVKSAIFSPDGQLILLRSLGNTLNLYALDGQLVQRFEHDNSISFAKFSSSGQKILSGSADHTAILWSIEGSALMVMKHDAPLIDGHLSMDEQLIISTSEDGVAKLWDENGDLLQSLKTQKLPVLPAVFSHDDQFLAFIIDGQSLKFWPTPKYALEKLLVKENFPNSKIKMLESKYDLNLQPIKK